MSAKFQIVPLALRNFSHLFSLDDAALARHGARRVVADAKPGFPCRVSLADAEPGERLVLLPFTHHAVDSPYRASGPIFVRENAREASLAPNHIPEVITSRLMSLRAYDKMGMMLGAKVTEGRQVGTQIEEFFFDPQVSYLHLHNAGPGCYSCRVARV
jgi:hypothetical protein